MLAENSLLQAAIGQIDVGPMYIGVRGVRLSWTGLSLAARQAEVAGNNSKRPVRLACITFWTMDL